MKNNNVYLLTLKMVFFFIISFGGFYILEYGFTFDSTGKLLVPLLLSGFTTIMLFKPKFKRYILFLSGVCLALMIFFNLLSLSKDVGNFGFSLLIVTIFLYLPQLIKKGRVEKF